MTDASVVEPLLVDVQNALSEQDASEAEEPPSARVLIQWARAAYAEVRANPSEVTIRVTNEAEITELNRSYRDKDKATNVLSFPVEMEFDFASHGNDDSSSDGEQAIDSLPIPLLGDIVICHAVIVAEATAQGKSVSDHYAHMVTHGILHLCGYDHENDASAEVMESLETKILSANGVADPY